MKEPLVEGDDKINLIAGSHVVSMVFQGRDGLYKVAMFHPITNSVSGLVEVKDSSAYRNMKPNQVTFVFSTVQPDIENPLTPNGIIVAALHAPFWDIIEELLGEQLEDMDDLRAVKATSRMFASLAAHVKSQDPSIEIFEKQFQKIDALTN